MLRRSARRRDEPFFKDQGTHVNSGSGILKYGLRRNGLRFILWWIFLAGLSIPGLLEASGELKPSLAILPFSVERAEEPGKGAICPICKGIRRGGEILPSSQNTLTRLLHEKMEVKETFRILPMKEVEDVLSQFERKVFEEKPISSSIQVGQKLNADFVCIGYFFRFEERIGSSLGVQKPASVSFDLHLFRLRDEKMVWLGKFDETQKPLSENVLKIGSFIRRKGSWLTAAELASVGMDEMLKKLPGARELEEK
jgi:hypothetical protein